jgi:hypothetical protein
MGAIDTNYTFTATDVITSTKMNNILDQSTITATAVFNNTLDVASGKLLVKAGGITSNELGAGSVTSNAIADGAIVNADINASADIAGSKLADASVTSAKLSQPLTLATSQSASGTSVDFTGIPSWAKRITVMLVGVGTNGSSRVQLQIGAGSIVASGYVSSSGSIFGSNQCAVSTSSTGLIIEASGATTRRHGHMSLTLVSENTWVSSHSVGDAINVNNCGGGSISLLGTLNRIRLTTVNGTDTFDAGVINIIYE